MMYVIIAFISVAIVGSIYIGFTLGGRGKTTSGPFPVTTTITGGSGAGALYQSPTLIPSTVCPAPNQAQTAQVTVAYPDYSKPLYNGQVQLTAVGSQNINSYAQSPVRSSSPTFAAVSSSTTGVAVPASGTLTACTTYLETAGDNSGYFLNYTFMNLQQATGVPIQIVAPKYTAPILQFSNSSSTANANSLLATIHSITLSSSKSYTFYLSVQGGLYTSCFALDQGCAVSFASNNIAISSIALGSLSQSNGVPVPAMSFVTSNTNLLRFAAIGSQNSQVTFLLSGDLSNSRYANPGSGEQSAQVMIPVTVTTTSAIANNEIIGVQIVAGTGFFNSTSAAFQTGLFRNPQTNANLLAPVINANALVLDTT